MDGSVKVKGSVVGGETVHWTIRGVYFVDFFFAKTERVIERIYCINGSRIDWVNLGLMLFVWMSFNRKLLSG